LAAGGAVPGRFAGAFGAGFPLAMVGVAGFPGGACFTAGLAAVVFAGRKACIC
jgi:formate/nitrite transporter FocA (FNT family)